MISSGSVVVIGGSLAGMAAAARLAKNRHDVIMVETADRLGGRYAGRVADGHRVDDLPGMITFPAPWRDLFRKSGRDFETELARTGLGLVPAPASRHRFADGTELVLGTDRGVQLAQLTQAYGLSVATRWRDLVDHLDDVRQALRPLGSEYDLASADQIARSGLRQLVRRGRTVEHLAAEIDEPHLAMIIRATAWRIGSAPHRTPAWCAAQLSIERTFGRWMMQRDGAPTRTGELADALADRLTLRRVDVRLGTTATTVRSEGQRHTVMIDSPAGTTSIDAAAVICAIDPWRYAELTGDRSARRWLRPASAAVVDHRLAHTGSEEPTETVEHTRSGPVITWTRPVGDATMISIHDWSAGRPDPAAGIAWGGERTWLRMPPISTSVPGRYLVGPHSRGGADLSAVVLSGALASYACHDHLTSR